jgi:hypothetical protein
MSTLANVMQPKTPPRGYKCPVCEAENFPVMLVNTIVPLKYSAGKQVGEITALRTIAGCANCGSVVSIQFIPVELPAAADVPPGPRIIHPQGFDA